MQFIYRVNHRFVNYLTRVSHNKLLDYKSIGRSLRKKYLIKEGSMRVCFTCCVKTFSLKRFKRYIFTIRTSTSTHMSFCEMSRQIDRPIDRFNFICIRVIIMRTLGKLLYLLTIVIMMLRITLYIRDEVIVEIIIEMIVEISYWTISWKFFTYMKLLHLYCLHFSV